MRPHAPQATRHGHPQCSSHHHQYASVCLTATTMMVLLVLLLLLQLVMSMRLFVPTRTHLEWKELPVLVPAHDHLADQVRVAHGRRPPSPR
jgi:hypothetical protein